MSFADDSFLFGMAKSTTALQLHFDKLNEWAERLASNDFLDELENLKLLTITVI